MTAPISAQIARRVKRKAKKIIIIDRWTFIGSQHPCRLAETVSEQANVIAQSWAVTK